MSYNINNIITNTEALLKLRHDETLTTTTPQRLHDCLGTAVMMAINEAWTASKKAREGKRKAYYFSAEYLLGRLVYSASNRDLVSIFGKEGSDCSRLVFSRSGWQPEVTAGILRQESLRLLQEYFGRFVL